MTWSATRLVSPNGRHVLDFLFGNHTGGGPSQIASMGLKNILDQNAPAQTVCTDNWMNGIP